MARRAVNGANGVEGAGGPGSCERQLPKSAKTDLLTQGSEVQSLSLAQVLNLTNHSRERRDRITNHFSLLLCAFESLGEIAFINVYLRPLAVCLAVFGCSPNSSCFKAYEQGAHAGLSRCLEGTAQRQQNKLQSSAR